MSKYDEAHPNNPQGGTIADKRTIRLNTNGDLELRAQKMLLLLFSQSIKVFRRRTRVFQGNATATTLSPRRPRAGMAVMCLASSSHSWHECDDRAERIELIRVRCMCAQCQSSSWQLRASLQQSDRSWLTCQLLDCTFIVKPQGTSLR